ncbi:NUDIX hydrolase [Zafaria sp. Z1313]|uniref:NUDIX hydrolase n=1 Tax=Zafaria sp. Z1313 TaxID=3423202 RepID=UPI003D303B34
MSAAWLDAATTVLLRDGAAGPEVLLLERLRHRGSFAGAWVFPGGHVDPEDDDGGAGPGASAEEALGRAVRRAGAREAWEETGLRPDPEELVPLSVWMPPASAPKQVRTWYFVGTAPEGDVVVHDAEHHGYRWLTPARALEEHAAGRMQLVPPTFVTLTRLAGHPDAAAALEAARASGVERYSSRLLEAGGRRLVLWDGDEDYDRADHAASGRTASGPIDSGLTGVDEAGEGRPAAAGPAGARHRLDVTGLPWRYERTV